MSSSSTTAAAGLDGMYAVITGGTQGLGAAAARLFAARGAAGLIVNGRDAERGRAVADALSADGCPTRFVQADVSDVDACRGIIAAAADTFGALHVLVNAAALTERGTIWDTSPELFDSMFRINVRAPFLLMQDAVKLMRREKTAGSIVNISSVASHGSLPMLCPYAASKSALNTLTKNVAYSVMRDRIRVNAINLGWMDSPGEDVIQRRYHSDGGDWLEAAEAAQPFGRLIKPEEAARVIAYLASGESGMLTGALIDYDQSVIGAGPQPVPPPYDEWEPVAGVSFG